MKTKHAIYGLFAALLLFGCSQSDFLENENKANLSDDILWASEGNADISLNDCYAQIPMKPTMAENLDYYTDDYNISHYYTASNWRKGICVAPTSPTSGEWNGSHGPTYGYDWNSFGTKIRKVNTFLQKVQENAGNFSDEWRNRRTDEARFLRAFFYAEYFALVGGLPILTVPLDRHTMADDEIRKPRATFEETFSFITKELGEIVDNGHLAVKYSKSDGDAGRATLGAALALKGWVELFAASPLFNTATPYLPDPDKIVHFGSHDPARWATAAATNKKFIDEFANAGPYGLFADLPNLFRVANEYNEEIIWDRQVVANIPGLGSNYERRGGVTFVLGEYRSWGNYNPTQELVDQFAMANGKTIAEAGSGYDPQNPYVDREKRFYDFIVYNGAPYKLDWMPATDIIYTRVDETLPDDKNNMIDIEGKDDRGDSGYYQKKRINPDAPPGNDMSGQNHVFFRYAEVLLNYAEAQNEAAGPDASVYDAVNQVRARSALPALPPGLSQADMRTAIRRERRVELCFEDKRFLDNKRWAQMPETMGVPVHNMVIRNTVPADNSGIWTYSVEPNPKYTPVFLPKQYMSPIPQSVVDQNPKIVQNPGY